MELTEIPLSLAEIIGEKIAYKGLFVVWPNQKLENLEHVKLEALKNFKFFNDERIAMEQSYLDERRKAGITIDMAMQYNYNKWAKWSQELAIILKQKNVVEAPKSFLTTEEKPAEEVSDPVVASPKRRGRPPLQKKEEQVEPSVEI